ncbi:type IV toxin-antitoxin system AbiEi family antitoxin domain-containing protein [Imhoffiella purpurea]|uniref:Transcriptional regulator n=1 Tax=Imhoffiella purpurea TaxID=1249627 RepID=W9V5D6_9GAMM|nr:hypothetical protein [Imhoffiella purpurea]EXJ14554.1 hypothetical protein D779_2346 [Imhoffiella purpurea]
METLTESIIAAGWAERILTEGQLARLLDGTAQRRYNLVNRALHRGELMRLRRGRYRLAASVSGKLAHPFVVAQALRPGCYVSLESALSFHGWIPEAVPMTLGILPGRRREEYEIPRLGTFRFWPLAVNPGFFLEAVERVVIDGQTALVARPLRALLDRFCLLKRDWPGAKELAHDMRIDPDLMASLGRDELDALRPLYRHRRMRAAIDAMERELVS